MKKKKYPVTSKIKYAFQKFEARKKLGEFYVKSDKHDRAVKTFEEAELLKDKGWNLIFELYPKLRGEEITYIWSSKEIIIKEKVI